MSILFKDIFTSLANWTSVTTAGTATIVSGELKLHKTGNSWDTLGVYKTVPITMQVGHTIYYTFRRSGSDYYWYSALCRTDASISDTSSPTNLAGLANNGTNQPLYAWQQVDGIAITSTSLVIPADTNVDCKIVCNSNGTLQIYSKLSTDPTYTNMGVSTVANGGDFRNKSIYVSLGNIFLNTEDLFFDNFVWTNDGLLSPTPPSALAATTNGQTEIDLTWTDNGTSTSEDTISIERSLTSGSGFAEITTVPQGTTSYADTGLDSGTIYFYRIRGQLTFNAVLYSSAYSAEATAETVTPDADGDFFIISQCS